MTPRSDWGRFLLLIGRFALAAVFFATAYAKVKPQGGMPWTVGSIKLSLAMFALGVDSFQVLPQWAVNPVAHLLPPFEFMLGLWILSGITLRYSSLLATLLLATLFFAMVRAHALYFVGPARLVRDGIQYLPLALAVTAGSFMKHRESQVIAPHNTSRPASLR
jgi:uncharacterized membrane protein YphA (DoxX/SURF4 family)